MKPLLVLRFRAALMRSFHSESRLHPLLKKSRMRGFVSGHDFRRADKALNFAPPRGLQSARRVRSEFPGKLSTQYI